MEKGACPQPPSTVTHSHSNWLPLEAESTEAGRLQARLAPGAHRQNVVFLSLPLSSAFRCWCHSRASSPLSSFLLVQANESYCYQESEPKSWD